MKWHDDDFSISDDSSDIDIPAVHRLLSGTYWAAARPQQRTEDGMRASVCFSLKHAAQQIGFARVITDGGCYAVVVDVVIDSRFQRRGLGSWLMKVVSSHSRFEGMVLVLWTSDQVAFYQACGLSEVADFHVMRRAPAWMGQKQNQSPEHNALTRE